MVAQAHGGEALRAERHVVVIAHDLEHGAAGKRVHARECTARSQGHAANDVGADGLA